MRLGMLGIARNRCDMPHPSPAMAVCPAVARALLWPVLGGMPIAVSGVIAMAIAPFWANHRVRFCPMEGRDAGAALPHKRARKRLGTALGMAGAGGQNQGLP